MKLPLFIYISIVGASTAIAQVPAKPTSQTPPRQTPGGTTTISAPCSPIASIQTGSALGSIGTSTLLTQTGPSSTLSSSTSFSTTTFGSSTSSPASGSLSMMTSPSSTSMTSPLGV